MIDGDDELSRTLGATFPAERAPERLHAWARERARESEAAPAAARTLAPMPRSTTRGWTTALRAAGILLCIGVGWGGRAMLDARAPSPAVAMLPAELVDDHVRALATGHLTDVVSSDRHTVKPWFAGRTDLAPRVESLDSAGFPLLGGRLSYVQGHRAAVLVYGRRAHVIDLYVWRAPEGDAGDARAEVAGHAVRHWVRGGLAYWAVTDAAKEELDAFRDAYEAPR